MIKIIYLLLLKNVLFLINSLPMKPLFLAPLLKLIRNFKPSVKARLCHTPCVFVLIGFKS